MTTITLINNVYNFRLRLFLYRQRIINLFFQCAKLSFRHYVESNDNDKKKLDRHKKVSKHKKSDVFVLKCVNNISCAICWTNKRFSDACPSICIENISIDSLWSDVQHTQDVAHMFRFIIFARRTLVTCHVWYDDNRINFVTKWLICRSYWPSNGSLVFSHSLSLIFFGGTKFFVITASLPPDPHIRTCCTRKMNLLLVNVRPTTKDDGNLLLNGNRCQWYIIKA